MTIQTAIAALESVLGDGLTRSKSDLDIHGACETHFAPTPPDAVVYPRSTEEVAAVVRTCAEHGCPVVGWGAGTSLEGHALAVRGGIVMDFSKMNKVLAVNAEDMDCVVQPGITRRALAQELRATGLFFSVDPGADASIGGMAATRASGTTTVRYGNMRDNVLGLEVVLADGRIIRTGSRARKSAAGYDLTGLFLGSEGTLGLITELTLRLHGQPEAVSAAVCAFPDIGSAVNAVIATIQMGIPMARIEFVDGAAAAAFNAYKGTDFPEVPHLMLEFHGSDASVAEDSERFGEVAAEFGAENFQWATTTEDRNQLWRMRHDAAYAIKSMRPGWNLISTDICVPISQLATAVEETQADVAETGLYAPLLGHVGDGNFHATLMLNPEDAEDAATAKAFINRLSERSLRLGGTVTGEHGIGMGKMALLEAEHGPAVPVMADIKRTFDPKNILNPGKIFQQN